MYDAVVTGCAGFVGSHLCEALTDRGDRVLGIDSLDTYYSPRTKRKNLTALEGRTRFTFVRGDVRRIPIRKYLGAETRVYHLAAQPGVRGSWGTSFPRYVTNNVLATHAILEALAATRGHPRIVYASSSSVYGETAGGPTSEESPTRPISPYGMTKLAAEHLVHLYGRERGLSTVSLRFFTVYGPRQRPDMAFHRFFSAVRASRPIEVIGDGRQLRDFTYVGDIVSGIVAGGDLDGAGEVFNLGAGSPVPLRTAIEWVGEAAGAEVAVGYIPAQAGDPKATWADNRRARRRLRFRPCVDLKEGLRRQWAWQGTEGPPAPPPA
ncbi:MAG: NAD-dependent epimerase/dehydratase family protein [Thermoplasmata archaeon]